MTQEASGWAIGWGIFAAILMILHGSWNVIAGLVALLQNEFYFIGREYFLEFDVTAWGWVHLIIGVVMLLAGFALFRGATWARAVGVIVAVVAGIASFAWLPHYPVWGALMVTASIFVIWALTTHGRDMATMK